MKPGNASLLFCYPPENIAMNPVDTAPVIATSEPKGVVYTKEWVVNLLLDLAGYVSTANLINSVAVEPSAGNGAFLGPMIRRLLVSCKAHGRKVMDCSDSIVAYELDESSAAKARDLARELLEGEGVAPQEAEKLVNRWIRCADYLFEDWSLQADFVIGNPPYIRLEDMPENVAATYRQAYGTMRGRADLYVAFFEAALKQLKDGGICAFICADRWIRNQYGAELRRLVTTGYSVEFLVEMHDARPFQDEVDAYPAITVIRRQSQSKAVVATANPDVNCVDPAQISNSLLALAHGGQICSPTGIRAAVVDSWFKGSDPWTCRTPAQLALLRRLEDRFIPLESEATCTRVGIGVATGSDEVFITKHTEKVESSRLLKLALAEDIRSGTLRWSGHYLIDPWDENGLVDLEKFPKLAAYFEAHAGAVKNRNIASRNRGAWFRTIDRVNHGLMLKSKLYIPDIKDRLSPVLDRGETYPHHNLYFVQSDLWDLEVLGGLLLSDIAQFFIESYGIRMRGGYLRFQAQYLRRIRVPRIAQVSGEQARELQEAFRTRDKVRATHAALQVYGINSEEMEQALEY